MYCTAKDVREANELLNDESIFTEIKLNPWILKAQGRIDVVLKSRYIVPLTEPIPDIIKGIAQDMAVGFVIENVFSNQLGQEQIILSKQLIKRADDDLEMVVEKNQLDGLPGVKLTTIPGNDASPMISSTTRRTSPIEEIIKQW